MGSSISEVADLACPCRIGRDRTRTSNPDVMGNGSLYGNALECMLVTNAASRNPFGISKFAMFSSIYKL